MNNGKFKLEVIGLVIAFLSLIVGLLTWLRPYDSTGRSPLANILQPQPALVVTASPVNAQSSVQKANKQVTIAANQLWSSTGVQVSRGDRVDISYVSGTWTVNKNNPGDGYVDAEGNPSGMIAGYPYAAMIGEIAGGPVFLVGNHTSFTAESSGMLLLQINDGVCSVCSQPFEDNAGSITMQITVQTQ